MTDIAMTGIVEDLGDLPPRSKVEALAGFGLSPSEIADVVDVDLDRLKAAFPKELGNGHLKANAKVAENLFRKATGDGREAVTAAIFWLKTRARWRETSIHEIAKANEPVDLSRLSDAELEAIILELAPGAAGAAAGATTTDCATSAADRPGHQGANGRHPSGRRA